MTTEWLGGGFMIALAAVLWLVYLVPSWFRSRQYLATERNAVRLQQTLRILAETAEMPNEVRVEANARRIVQQERLLKQHAAEQAAEAVPAVVRTADRIRRSRAVTSGVLALSLLVAVLGGVQLATNGTWVILAGGVLAGIVSVAVLLRLAKVGRSLRLPLSFAPAAPEFVDHALGDDDALGNEVEGAAAGEVPSEAHDEALDDDDGWVPVAVPRPLYLARASAAPLGLDDADDELDAGVAGRSTAAVAIRAAAAANPSLSARDAHEALQRAAAEAEQSLRERLRAEHETVAELESAGDAAVDPSVRPAAQAAPEAPPSRFASMGIVEGDTSSHLDLDDVLARRRAG